MVSSLADKAVLGHGGLILCFESLGTCMACLEDMLVLLAVVLRCCIMGLQNARATNL